MRLLWVSNYTSYSGYANQARLIVPRLQALGHTVMVLDVTPAVRAPYTLDGVTILPLWKDATGNDAIVHYMAQYRLDALITLIDTHAILPAVYEAVPSFAYAPVDHQPIPPNVLRSLRACTRPIAYSRFGYTEMTRAGLEPLYAPHSFDPCVFAPIPQSAARRALGWDSERFIVSFAGVNNTQPSRKGIPELLMAWQLFSQAHDDVTLYLHTDLRGVGGVDIPKLLEALRLDNVQWVDQSAYAQGLPQTMLTYAYSASDWFILPSRGEGFGLPLIEAQACGCPVITTDFAAGSELCASGLLIAGDSEWSDSNSFRLRPDLASILDCLEQAYARRGNPTDRLQAQVFAQSYTIEATMQQWRVVLKAMEDCL